MAHAKAMENLSIEKNKLKNAFIVLPTPIKQEVLADKAGGVIFFWLTEGYVNILGASIAPTSPTR